MSIELALANHAAALNNNAAAMNNHAAALIRAAELMAYSTGTNFTATVGTIIQGAVLPESVAAPAAPAQSDTAAQELQQLAAITDATLAEIDAQIAARQAQSKARQQEVEDAEIEAEEAAEAAAKLAAEQAAASAAAEQRALEQAAAEQLAAEHAAAEKAAKAERAAARKAAKLATEQKLAELEAATAKLAAEQAAEAEAAAIAAAYKSSTDAAEQLSAQAALNVIAAYESAAEDDDQFSDIAAPAPVYPTADALVDVFRPFIDKANPDSAANKVFVRAILTQLSAERISAIAPESRQQALDWVAARTANPDFLIPGMAPAAAPAPVAKPAPVTPAPVVAEPAKKAPTSVDAELLLSDTMSLYVDLLDTENPNMIENRKFVRSVLTALGAVRINKVAPADLPQAMAWAKARKADPTFEITTA